MVDVEKLKQKILDLAIRGKLVPQDPNDEPASVLINEIKAEKAKLVKEGKIKPSKEESYIYKGSDNFYYEKMPNNWSIVSLGELISLKSGVDLKLNEINTNQMGIPYLTGASCFNNGNLDIIRWTKFSTNITHKGDLLITVKGTIGEMAFNNIGDAHIARQIMSISISPYINPFYVFYVLEARKNELIQKSSSLIPGITRDNVLLFQIAVPPRNEQDKIVEALKTSLGKIKVIKENIEEISNISALIKSQILSSVFGENSSYKSYYQFSDIFEFQNGYAFSSSSYSDKGTPIIRISDLSNGIVSLKKCIKVKDIVVDDKFIVYKGDLLIAMSGATTGKMGVFIDDEKCYLNQRVGNIKIKRKDVILPKYRDYLFMYLSQEILKSAYGGAQPNISSNKILSMSCYLPSLGKQQKQIEQIEKAFDCLSSFLN